ncbi:queuosine precursor transporter [Clostridium sp. BJN0001]|uniref:queuosine precursor transporter n=1 Tax=Clostridium sp. BJN0001 TaxID=2930219 RepID=UPI001FD3A43B|nr:queuosine precursor transporter [Clostridium sp. BJN0001]
MNNEILLFINLIVVFGGVLLAYYLFGKSGLYGFTVFATITANIEVLILIDAFKMQQTLGNIMFASTFLITDILSEMYGKESSKKAVNIGIATSILFIVVSQIWLLYTPNENDWAMPYMKTIFSNTPRLMFASFIVYAISQRFDVWAYHKWWAFTEKKFHDRKRFLWLRNNGSTLISQFINTFLFAVFAFYGVYEIPVLLEIVWSSYIIFIATSLLDTPVIYAARLIKPRCE